MMVDLYTSSLLSSIGDKMSGIFDTTNDQKGCLWPLRIQASVLVVYRVALFLTRGTFNVSLLSRHRSIDCDKG
jgi:hypothetical protein